jgi:hypothetical protein
MPGDVFVEQDSAARFGELAALAIDLASLWLYVAAFCQNIAAMFGEIAAL